MVIKSVFRRWKNSTHQWSREASLPSQTAQHKRSRAHLHLLLTRNNNRLLNYDVIYI